MDMLHGRVIRLKERGRNKDPLERGPRKDSGHSGWLASLCLAKTPPTLEPLTILPRAWILPGAMLRFLVALSVANSPSVGDRHFFVDAEGHAHAGPFCRGRAGRVLGGALPETLARLRARGCQAFPRALPDAPYHEVARLLRGRAMIEDPGDSTGHHVGQGCDR